VSVEEFCTFEVGAHLVGIETRRIQEILRPQPLTPVPLAPTAVRGLMSLRGQIVLVIDLRTRLGVPGRDDPDAAFNVLVRMPDGPISLLVDRVCDVVEVSAETFEDVPDTLQGSARQLLRGAFRLERKLLLALDCESAVNSDLS
jgi:purine-binding chemotaxis protein CheW